MSIVVPSHMIQPQPVSLDQLAKRIAAIKKRQSDLEKMLQELERRVIELIRRIDSRNEQDEFNINST